MITSCNHSSTEKLCGSCREKNYRQSFLDEKDARIADLERQLAELREAAHGLLGALSNGSFMPSPNWPTVVFEGALKVYLENRAEVERLLEGK